MATTPASPGPAATVTVRRRPDCFCMASRMVVAAASAIVLEVSVVRMSGRFLSSGMTVLPSLCGVYPELSFSPVERDGVDLGGCEHIQALFHLGERHCPDRLAWVQYGHL